MKMNIKHRFFLLGFLLFFVIFPLNFSKAAATDPPIIISIDQTGGTYFNRPLIKGLTPVNTEVMIYIDGVYAGDAHINQENTATNNYYFQPIQPVSSGEHVIEAVAKDINSQTLSVFSNQAVFKANEFLPAPTLIEPNKNTITGKVKPLIKGLTLNNTLVYVYVDGTYNGKTEILNDISGTANFAYEPFLNLNIGWHTARAIAEDQTGRKSKISNILYFNIEEPLPAPLIYDPVVNSNSVYNKPFIIGLAKNDLKINVYIDHKLNGSFKVKNDLTGTANFAYQPFQSLKNGSHLVYTESVDARGKTSRWSNIIYFNVSRPITPAISLEAALEEPIVKSEAKGFVDETDSFFKEPTSPPEETRTKEIDALDKETKAADDEVIDEIGEILQQTELREEETGAINESKEQQGKLKLNLVIFILFLLAIIIWIFWVNRELIKERRAQADEEGKKDSLAGREKKEKNNKNTSKFNL